MTKREKQILAVVKAMTDSAYAVAQNTQNESLKTTLMSEVNTCLTIAYMLQSNEDLKAYADIFGIDLNEVK